MKLTDSAARVILLRALDWPADDLRRLAYLISLGKPDEVVALGPPVEVATTCPASRRGPRCNMRGVRWGGSAGSRWRARMR